MTQDRARQPHRPPRERTHARDEFLGLKWLLEVIVRSRVETVDPLDPTRARRQDEDGHGPTSAAPQPENVKSRHAREAKVEHHTVIFVDLALVPRFVAVARDVHDEPRLPEDHVDPASKFRFIFDNQNTDAPNPESPKPHALEPNDG